MPPARSMPYIKKMMNKEPMTEAEIRAIVQDVVDDKLSDIEITAYVTAGYMRTPNMQETAWLTKAMIDTGDTIHFANHPVADKHSIGGVPGNKVTLLVVPIVAAAGLPIPKTCSRAITGAGGTADLMEIIASVEFKADEVKELTEKNGAVIVWGGATNIAPSDDKLIRPEYELTIDPYSQMLASIMAKKGAVGADIVVMDMPVGPGTKLPTMEHAKRCAKDIIELGKMLGMRVECAATFGGAPMGRTVGPGLEVVEALRMLEGKGGPTSLREKSLELAGILLEMGGKAAIGSGYSVAEQLLVSGKAHEKFLDIVEIQGGDRKVTSEAIPMGDHVVRVYSPRHGFVQSFRNKRIVEVARLAGAPDDKGAGVFLHKKMGESIKKGEPIFTIYSSTESGADAALASMNADLPVTIDGMLMERMAE